MKDLCPGLRSQFGLLQSVFLFVAGVVGFFKWAEKEE